MVTEKGVKEEGVICVAGIRGNGAEMEEASELCGGKRLWRNEIPRK